jgi:hypothetical protein
VARGGKRTPGPGKKIGRPRVLPELPAIEANKSIATRVLAQIDEEQKWKDLLEAQDVRVRFEVLRYLTDKRDGKPMQRSEIAGKSGSSVSVQILTNVVMPNE